MAFNKITKQNNRKKVSGQKEEPVEGPAEK